jgi:hypothetical protein
MPIAIRAPARADTRNLKVAAIIEKANAIRQVVSLQLTYLYFVFGHDFELSLGFSSFRLLICYLCLYGTGSGE